MVSYELLAADYGLVRVRAISDRTPPIDWRVLVDGDLVATATTDDASFEIDIPVIASSERGPFVEFLDHDAILPTPAAPDRWTIHWTEIAGAEAYLVRVFDGSWTTIATVPRDPRRAYSHRSPSHGHGDIAVYGVVPIDAAGNVGSSPTLLVLSQVRHPDVPTPTIEYDGAVDGTITITI